MIQLNTQAVTTEASLLIQFCQALIQCGKSFNLPLLLLETDGILGPDLKQSVAKVRDGVWWWLGQDSFAYLTDNQLGVDGLLAGVKHRGYVHVLGMKVP